MDGYESRVVSEEQNVNEETSSQKRHKGRHSVHRLKKDFRYKSEIARCLIYLKRCLIKRKKQIKKLKYKLEKYKNGKSKGIQKVDAACQTTGELYSDYSEVTVVKEEVADTWMAPLNAACEMTGELYSDNTKETAVKEDMADKWRAPLDAPWREATNEGSGQSQSLADQVKEAAESALQQTGMVYEPTSGMYYDYSTGYYYSAELGLYYHGTTQCYYYYDKEQNQFVFHSQPDMSQMSSEQTQSAETIGHTSSGVEGINKKEKRHPESKKRKSNIEEMIDSEDGKSLESVKMQKKSAKIDEENTESTRPDDNHIEILDNEAKKSESSSELSVPVSSKSVMKKSVNPSTKNKEEPLNNSSDEDSSSLEEGEYSKSEAENETVSDDSSSSDSDESVPVKYPPCMRIIIKETDNPSLKVGTLFLLTKDGGTLGREGSRHSVIIPEENVSRHHLTFSYNVEKISYFVVDMGSRNGTLLNGKRMSGAQQESRCMEVVHGSVIQLGTTKLLCHIHHGTATCGHCEPGLLMKQDIPPPINNYKRTSTVRQHKQELARIKIKYKIKPYREEGEKAEGEEPQLLPEGYEDKAERRRREVGSEHHGAKMQQAGIHESIASTNKGFKMLQKMGWSVGKGLGKEATGEQEPVPLLSNTGTSGLGLLPQRYPPSEPEGTKKARPNVWLVTQKRYNKLTVPKVFQEDEESDEGEDKG